MKKFLKILGIVCLGIVILYVGLTAFFTLLFGKNNSDNNVETSKTKVEESRTNEEMNISIDFSGDISSAFQENDNDYYETMQEAIYARYSSPEKLQECNMQNIVKKFEMNDYEIVCYNVAKDSQNETFVIAYFKVDSKGERRKYNYICSEKQERVFCLKPNIGLTELIQNEIIGSRFRRMNNINEKSNFVCGIIDDEFLEKNQNIYNLHIEGQKPDEIIEFESFGKTSYFWYYQDFVQPENIDNINVQFINK